MTTDGFRHAEATENLSIEQKLRDFDGCVKYDVAQRPAGPQGPGGRQAAPMDIGICHSFRPTAAAFSFEDSAHQPVYLRL